MARAIVKALRPKLVQGAALVQQATASSEAHDLYLKGRFFWNQRTKEGLEKARALFEQAIAIDPRYALAHSGLADAYSLSVQYAGARWAEVAPRAKEHALKAVALDDGLAEAHTSLGQVIQDEYDWSGAGREYKRAIELRPGYPTAHHWYALVLEFQGRIPEAQAEVELARQIDPTSFIISNVVAGLVFEARDFGRAIELSRKTIELNAGFFSRILLVESYLQMGRFAEAQAALDEAQNSSVLADGLRANVFAASGKSAEARRLLLDLGKRSAAEPLRSGLMAGAWLALGDKDAAFAWLQRGVEERDQSVFDLLINPRWDSIRPDPRFHALLRRMNLE